LAATGLAEDAGALPLAEADAALLAEGDDVPLLLHAATRMATTPRVAAIRELMMRTDSSSDSCSR
jgi:hypothetical protein